MNASRTHHSRLIQYHAPDLKFDGRQALKKQMLDLFARRKNGVSLRDAQKWFRGTAPDFVQSVYIEAEKIDRDVPTLSLSHYTRGKYFGTDDTSVAWSVLYNGVPLTSETSEAIARNYAAQQWAKMRGPALLMEWDGDTAVMIVLEEK